MNGDICTRHGQLQKMQVSPETHLVIGKNEAITIEPGA
jgi:hypothetical protein